MAVDRLLRDRGIAAPNPIRRAAWSETRPSGQTHRSRTHQAAQLAHIRRIEWPSVKPVCLNGRVLVTFHPAVTLLSDAIAPEPLTQLWREKATVTAFDGTVPFLSDCNAVKSRPEPADGHLTGRIPSIDGLRAVSIAMVVIAHSRIEQRVLPILKPLVAILGNGPQGVSIFFVISGFLITKLLLEEEDRSGALSLRDFYVRRAFRILPACYAFLAALLILKQVGLVTVSPLGWLSAAFFARNYALPVERADWYTAHCWSLSVEEQFYLLWPLILRVAGRRKATWIASLLIAAGPFSRAITYEILPSARTDIIYLTHTRVDTLMFGCLTALLWHSVCFRRIVQRAFLLRFPLLLAIGVLVASAPLTTAYGGRYLFTVGYTLEGLSIVALLLWVVEHPLGLMGRMFNSQTLRPCRCVVVQHVPLAAVAHDLPPAGLAVGHLRCG